MLNKIIRYFLDNPLVTSLLLAALVGWGLVTAPFGWDTGFLPKDPVPVDAIPDIGENQQIVFTEWKGRSPQDIEDQITYPLTTSLLGIPGVKSIRSSSIFGVSSIYIIFNEDIEFYWSRSRILEKLNSLQAGLLPEGVQPSLGPDATALGQVYWYTLEGRDPEGNPTGGWDLHELRTVQDFYVKYGLNAVDGVSEVASIGGFVQEYQVDVNPNALRAYNITLSQVMSAVRQSNRDVGAKTIEINQAEYLVRGLGYVKSVEDIALAVVTVNDNVPIRVQDVGVVSLGPATRRGLLDKDGAEVVGGVVVARYGSNPLAVINQVKDKIQDISPGLPKKTLANGVESQLTIVPFYDRTQLIQETLGTLEEALSLEILITILVVIVMVLNLRASLLISSLLPIAVLMVFIAMRYFGVDANIVALSGIAIAIGTMVDLGIVLSENVINHIQEAPKTQALKETIYKASAEVSSAIVTAVATTIVSFIPVFTMEAAEGKLFRPLAFTKTFALLAALFVSLIILPTLARWFFGMKINKKAVAKVLNGIMLVGGLVVALWVSLWAGMTLVAFAVAWFVNEYDSYRPWAIRNASVLIALFSVTWLLAKYWMPLGASESTAFNFFFVTLLLVIILGSFALLEKYYSLILDWCLAHKKTFLALPMLLISLGLMTWIGFSSTFGWVDRGLDAVGVNVRTTKVWSVMNHTFPGIGKEFMPSLDEGSFLLMPTSMPHAGMTQNKRVVQQLDMLLANIPEVELAVGKMGRAETALDPAPISMYETVINYRSEYRVSESGHRERYLVDDQGDYLLTAIQQQSKNIRRWVLARDKTWLVMGQDTVHLDNRMQAVESVDFPLNFDVITSHLIPDADGDYFRNWRAHIQSPDDIWQEIIAVAKIPGVTSAPKLQPIETRLVMLQTGMRAPMGIKVFGPDLKTIEAFGLQLEAILKEVPSVKSEAVFADRIVGKPYIHLNIDRQAIARYGLSVEDVQQTIETAIGGMQISSTVEGRERFPIRVRYPRELRDDPSALAEIYVPTPTGVQVPMGELVDIEYVQGPQMIKSENTFLLGYVLLDKKQGYAEVDVVEEAQRFIQNKIDQKELIIPGGVSYKFSGSYENQIRAEKRLAIIVPLVLAIIFLILYFQFKSISTSLMIFTGIAMAFSGAFLMLWLYGQAWFLDFSLMGTNMRDLFQIHTINLSVAVWVGFIALFGIATDDGVLIGTYLDYSMAQHKPSSISAIRVAVREAGRRRIKPAIMTSATTIIALLPVLTSTGRGSDIMIPMAIPAFGGMLVAAITYFITPVLYSWREERKLKQIQFNENEKS
ncbi:efflux RND transporter permease subunit [Reichenbachiella sp. MSK19-1]|uniref:efflux RND transporter permease subunit n=1 Tax=Reichenbachiella sp. MSK19-1 TaxID=1897631 RepID=UPI000E6CFC18|nr:efflux RND transporter permease subunit [Reichenbachiella sp. MSK19-1]RJE70441.1 cation transporter [Reichenbachiella sp. MSK19-1]